MFIAKKEAMRENPEECRLLRWLSEGIFQERLVAYQRERYYPLALSVRALSKELVHY
jgi:hypothetical protein